MLFQFPNGDASLPPTSPRQSFSALTYVAPCVGEADDHDGCSCCFCANNLMNAFCKNGQNALNFVNDTRNDILWVLVKLVGLCLSSSEFVFRSIMH